MVLAHNIEEYQRTQDVRISQNVTFDTMLLTSKTLQGLKSSGFFRPSPIQLHAIPLGKCGFDLLLEAKSGTGKTAVFSIIALEKIDFKKGLQAVMLAPTREIAAQIHDVIKQIGSSYEDLQVEVVMGGLPVHEDIAKFQNKKVHIVVGSPGRLRHLIQDNHINISTVRLLVLDEADKLMEKSFQADVKNIFNTLPRQKQVIMSSATYPEISKSFIEQYVQNAQHICPDSNNILLGIEQKVTVVKYNANIVRQTQNKFTDLLKIIKTKQFKQCIIFCNYQARVAELHKMLTKEKWPAEQLHGQQEQINRLDALKSLQEYRCRILISTDLAARGIDAFNVDLIINFEAPFDWPTYLHRIGRAGRFGSYGIAVTILSDGKELKQFKEMLGSINVLLNLSNLWSGEKFYIDDLDTSLSPQIKEDLLEVKIKNENESTIQQIDLENNFEVLWNIITETKQSTDTDNQIESFEMLCHSFTETNNSEIESFSDLINCFQSNLFTTDNSRASTYKLWKIQKLPKDYFISIRNMCGLIESPLKNYVGNNKSNNNLETKHKHEEYLKIQNTNDMNTVTENSKFERQNTNHVREEKPNATTPDNKSQYFNEIETVQTEALLNAGLPTSFGSSKIKHNRSKIRKNDFTERSFDKDYYSRSYSEKLQSSGRNNKYNAKYNVPRSTHPNNVIDDSDDCGYNTYRCSSNKSQYYDTYNKHAKAKKGMKNNCDADSNNSYYFRCDDHQHFENHSSTHTHYVNWYYQLKFRTKQIAHAVYIEEFSKFSVLN